MTPPSVRVAALTMAHNEPFLVPLWVRHYVREVGAAHCYLIDHGSDDGSTDGLPIEVLPRPRGVRDENERVAVVSAVVGELLRRYDVVLHTDIDELLVADPLRFRSLADYAATAPDVTTALGLDLHHIPDEEPAFDASRPIGAQRRWVRFAAAMCKPALVRRQVAWSPGFHSSDAPLRLDALFLFHLRYVDLGRGLERLAATRAMTVAEPGAHVHQRVPDAAFRSLMHAVAGLPRREPDVLDTGAPPLAAWAERLRRSRSEREDQTFKLDLGLSGDELWALPPAFRAAL